MDAAFNSVINKCGIQLKSTYPYTSGTTAVNNFIFFLLKKYNFNDSFLRKAEFVYWIQINQHLKSPVMLQLQMELRTKML